MKTLFWIGFAIAGKLLRSNPTIYVFENDTSINPEELARKLAFSMRRDG